MGFDCKGLKLHGLNLYGLKLHGIKGNVTKLFKITFFPATSYDFWLF